MSGSPWRGEGRRYPYREHRFVMPCRLDRRAVCRCHTHDHLVVVMLFVHPVALVTTSKTSCVETSSAAQIGLMTE